MKISLSWTRNEWEIPVFSLYIVKKDAESFKHETIVFIPAMKKIMFQKHRKEILRYNHI